MKASWVTLLTFVLSANAWASDRNPDDGQCRRFQFRGGGSAYVRPDFVGTASGVLEVGAPKDLWTLGIVVPAADAQNVPPAFQSAGISAFFRPMRTVEPECDAAASPSVVCYKRIFVNARQPMQLRVTLDVTKDTSVDPVEATNRVAAFLQSTAFACGDAARSQ